MKNAQKYVRDEHFFVHIWACLKSATLIGREQNEETFYYIVSSLCLSRHTGLRSIRVAVHKISGIMFALWYY